MAHVTTATPRPVVDAAARQAFGYRIIGGASVIAGAVPGLLLAFEVIDWNATQMGAYMTFLGVVTGAVMFIFGYQTNATALAVEALVTPIADTPSEPDPADGE